MRVLELWPGVTRFPTQLWFIFSPVIKFNSFMHARFNSLMQLENMPWMISHILCNVNVSIDRPVMAVAKKLLSVQGALTQILLSVRSELINILLSVEGKYLHIYACFNRL